jgi:uncharacterized membrane protein HdeD (DUF308 family)
MMTERQYSRPASADALLDQRRLSLALRSGAGLLFAVAFLWPAITEATLVNLFAAYAFVDGVLVLSPGGWSSRCRPLWPLLVGGCVDIAAAAAAYAWPAVTLPDLVNLATVWAIALGITFTVASATLRQAGGDYLLLLSGIASALFGRALLSHPAGDVVIMSTWTGLYTLTLGILFLKLTLQLYRPIAIDLSAQ